ncbi:TPA: hypothetical protein EYO12_02095 [Candidatus Saccharibacteria bacterium]|nr:hypothetical protein [Candidatus Saccharibacteria bacterium]HIO87509.1 hypothetical protein [Candidatus Saccharibacteria bacterium]
MRREGSTVEYYTTPIGEYGGGQVASISEHESYVIDYGDDTLGFYEPVFNRIVTIGDGSFINEQSVGEGAHAAEQFIVELWKYGGLSSSTRQLSETEARSIKPDIGRWSRAQHQITSVIAAVEYGCSAQQVMVMAFHDEAHLLGSHDTEILFQPKHKGNHHDEVLGENGERSGFYDHLRDIGLVEGNRFVGIDMTLDDLVKEETETGILCQPNGFMEIDRFYIASEGYIWAAPKNDIQESLQHIQHMHNTPYGEQLVFTNIDAAVLWKRTQARLQAENWAEPVRFTVADLANQQIKFALASSHTDFNYVNQAHPSDTLYVAHEDHQEHLRAAGNRHGFINTTSRIIDAIVAQQRPVHAEYSFANPYTGPDHLPDWLHMGQVRLDVDDEQHTKLIGGSDPTHIVIELRAQKDRYLDPVVKLDGVDFFRTSSIPAIAGAVGAVKANGNKARQVVIDLTKFKDIDGNPLTLEDRRALHNGFRLIQRKWNEVLQKPKMTKEQFTAHMQRQNARYKELGKIVAETNLEQSSLEIAAA